MSAVSEKFIKGLTDEDLLECMWILVEEPCMCNKCFFCQCKDELAYRTEERRKFREKNHRHSEARGIA